MFWAQAAPADEILGVRGCPGAPEVLGKKRWGLRKRKRDSI